MKDEDKTKEQLISELAELRRRNAELEALEKKYRDAEEIYKKYTFITNTTRELMTLINRNYTYEVVNEPYYKAHNKARGEIIGKTVADIWGEEIFNTTIKGCIDKCFAGDNVHYQTQFKFGSELNYFDVSYYPYYNESGTVTHVVVVTRDITERKQAEETLRESEQRYRQLFESISDAVAIYNSPGKFLDCNEATLQRLGYSREEFLRLTPADIVHPDYHLVMKDNQKRIWAGETTIVELVHRCKDGRIIPVEVNSHCIEYQREPAILAVARDITERKRAEEALKMSEEKYRLIFENAKEGISIYEELKDGGRKLVESNPQYAEMSGYSLEELIQISDTRKIQVGHNTPPQEAVNIEKLLTGQPYKGIFSWIRPDGKENYVEYTATPFKIGSRECVVGIDHDITEQKLAQEELLKSTRHLSEALTELNATQQQIIRQERLRALGQMASGIAHDVNNALVPILGYSDVMLTFPQILDDKEKVKTLLGAIRTSANDAAEVVKRLSEFYRTRAENEVFIPIDLNQLVQRTIELTQPKWQNQALAAGITVRISSDLQEVPRIRGNESQLREMLTNLIFNSVDAMPNGGSITIRTYLNGEYVVLEVGDTGSGMTEEVRRRCFDPFFSTKAGRGTGLGLSLVLGIIQRHGGMINVDSESGKGTTFTICLPIQTEEQAEGEEKKVEATIRSLHILLVDDEQLVLDVLTAYLTEEGHTLETATNGREGLEKFYKGKFDLVVTDRAMPDMNGILMAELIKQFTPKVPVIMLTGFGDIMKVSEEIPESIGCLVSKPVTLSKLREALAKVTTE
ncbi:PAS domain S-box protein [Candidatus Poribacteria bacterium]|nr:PAS domain S-box protein [Candidatus Poribacteria bacterium]